MTGGKFSKSEHASRSITTSDTDATTLEGAPLGGTKAEATQRLQVGLFGIGAMVLLVGLASILGNQADRTEEGAVPDAAPTTEPTAAAPQRDPLADAGIVPDIPAEPSPAPTGRPLNAAPALPAGSETTADVAPQN